MTFSFQADFCILLPVTRNRVWPPDKVAIFGFGFLKGSRVSIALCGRNGARVHGTAGLDFRPGADLSLCRI